MTSYNIFLLYALFAGILASISGGVIGSYVVVKRIVFICGSIAHSVLGGMGLFLYLSRTYSLPWLKPLYGALVFALIAAYLIGWIHLRFRQREDTVIASIWASGMALGVLFLSLTPGYNVEVVQFLFGNILWTNANELIALAVLDSLIVFLVIIFHRRFLAICFDEKQAALQGVPVKGLYFLLLTLIAFTVVLLVQVVGAILVIAMLSLPPAIANLFTNRLSRMMILSVCLGIFFNLAGLGIAVGLNWPPGATIALTTTAFYFLSLIGKRKTT